jgi:hypothetical protein
LNVPNVSDVRQSDIHTAEPLVPNLNRLEVKIVIGKLTKHKSPGSDQIPAELRKTGSETLVSVFHKVMNSIWNQEELCDQWKESLIVPVHKKHDKTDRKNFRAYHCY